MVCRLSWRPTMTNTDTSTAAKPIVRTPKSAAAATLVPAPAMTAAPTKSATVIKLLLRARGATPMELIAATDWQPHSVRAFLSGLRKKGRVLAREPRKGGEAAYRIVAAAEHAADALADGATGVTVEGEPRADADAVADGTPAHAGVAADSSAGA